MRTCDRTRCLITALLLVLVVLAPFWERSLCAPLTALAVGALIGALPRRWWSLLSVLPAFVLVMSVPPARSAWTILFQGLIYLAGFGLGDSISRGFARRGAASGSVRGKKSVKALSSPQRESSRQGGTERHDAGAFTVMLSDGGRFQVRGIDPSPLDKVSASHGAAAIAFHGSHAVLRVLICPVGWVVHFEDLDDYPAEALLVRGDGEVERETPVSLTVLGQTFAYPRGWFAEEHDARVAIQQFVRDQRRASDLRWLQESPTRELFAPQPIVDL